ASGGCAAAAAHGGAAAPRQPNKDTTLGRGAVDLSASHALPLFLSNLPIFRGVDIKQFARLATWESDGLSVERARQLVQGKLPGGHLSLQDRQRRATQ